MRGFPKSASSILSGGNGNRLVKTNASGLLAESGIVIDGSDNLSGIGTLDVGGVATITGIADGGLTSYDLKVGDTSTPDYGMIQIGDGVVGRTSYNVASCDLDGSFIFRNIGTPATSNIEFAFLESGGQAIRFALAKSAAGNATYNPRSMLIAGPAVLDDEIVTVGYWQTNNSIFHNLACDTAGAGADLGVQNDLEVEGDIFADSIKESTSGADITFGNDTVISGTLTAATESLIGGGDTVVQRLIISNIEESDGTFSQLLLQGNEAYGATNLNNWAIGVQNDTTSNELRIQTRKDSDDASPYGFIANTLRIDRSGNIALYSELLWDTDGAGDIGNASDNRPNNIYAKVSIRAGGNFFGDSSIFVGGDYFTIGSPTTGTVPPGPNARWDVSGANYILKIVSSSVRYKENIAPTTMDTSKIYDLELKQYQESSELQNYNEKKARANGLIGVYEKDRGFYTGLIAEEVYEVNPVWTIPRRDSKGQIMPGEVESVDYQTIALCTLAELKKLKERVDLAGI